MTWRGNFLIAQSTNKDSIKTLQGQINALGPKPVNTEEAPEIAAQRIELDRHMAQLRAPGKTAEISYSRADGLIRSVDSIIRNRQTDALLKRGPSPLIPLHWAKGWDAIKLSFRNVNKEVSTAWASPSQQVLLKQSLPLVAVLLLIAFVLLLRGRFWMERLAMVVLAGPPTAGRWLLALVLSIAQLALPLLGLILLALAIYETSMIGVRGDIVLAALVNFLITFFLARWLGARIFPKTEFVVPPLNLSPVQRRKGRFFSGALGLALGLRNFAGDIGAFDSWSDEALVVILFPILILAGYYLLRQSRLIHQHVINDQIEGEERSYKNRVIYYHEPHRFDAGLCRHRCWRRSVILTRHWPLCSR